MARATVSKTKLRAEVEKELAALEPGAPGRTGLVRILAQLQRKPRKKKIVEEAPAPAPNVELDADTIAELRRRGLDIDDDGMCRGMA